MGPLSPHIVFPFRLKSFGMSWPWIITLLALTAKMAFGCTDPLHDHASHCHLMGRTIVYHHGHSHEIETPPAEQEQHDEDDYHHAADHYWRVTGPSGGGDLVAALHVGQLASPMPELSSTQLGNCNPTGATAPHVPLHLHCCVLRI
jgi:hypothetical protein